MFRSNFYLNLRGAMIVRNRQADLITTLFLFGGARLLLLAQSMPIGQSQSEDINRI